MTNTHTTLDEAARLAALARYEVLDSEPELSFDRLTQMAAHLFEVPLALVSLVDSDRQWFKSMSGEAAATLDVCQTPREVSFCSHALQHHTPMVIPDATKDARFADNPLVTGPLNIRFYAGAPLRTPEGFNIGSLCIIDTKPREDFSERDRKLLSDLAVLAVDELELRLKARVLQREIEEKQRAQDALQQSEKCFRALIENARDIITVMRGDGEILYQSPSLTRVLGYTPQEQVGQNALSYIHADDLELVGGSIRRALEEDFTVITEFRYRHHDGSFRVLEAVGSPVHDEFSLGENALGENVMVSRGCLVVNSRDVTERAQAQSRLHESEARYSRIAANVPGAVYQLVSHENGEYSLPFISEGSRELFGLEPQAITDDVRAFTNLMSQKQLAAFEKEIATSREMLRNWKRESRITLASGEEKWIQAQARVHGESDGSVVWDGIVLDITERKRDQERLRLLESVAIHANDAIIITKAEPVEKEENGPEILYANEAFTRMTGFELQDVLGKTPRILQGVKTSAEGRARIHAALKAWKPIVIEVINYRKDGSEFWVELSIVPVADETGWYTHWVSIQRDVGDRKTAERALQLALSEAESANQAKSEFLSRVSHELRTPLNAILGFGQLLEIDELSDDSRESAEQIMSAGKHLLQLINEVLDLSNIEQGRMRLSLEPVDVCDLIEETLSMVRPLADKAGVTIREYSRAAPRFVRADRQRLKQVLLNLLANAVKYNRAGGSVDVRCEENGDGRVALIVEDDGPGIAADDMAQLFTPFERLGAERTAVEGTGLGLALSKRLAEAMNGEIEASSVVGKGSIFRVISLPAEAPEDMSSHREYSRGAQYQNGMAPRRRVLYIEDNAANLQLMQQIFRTRSADELHVAKTGELGLEMARELRPALILLDLHLPGIGGDKVLRRLREDASTRDVPVVVVSADATPGQVEALLRDGAAHYLTKPIDIKELMEVIGEVAKKGSSW